MLFGYARTQALYVCVRLGVPDLVGDEPVDIEELAARVSAHPASLYRLLRFLASEGVFAEVAPGKFAGTRLSAGLREDALLSLRYFVLMDGCEIYRAWGDALYSVQTGKSAFDNVYGKSHFAYLTENPDAADVFNRAMAGSAPARVATLLAFDWHAASVVADIGGGNGTLLAELLTSSGRLHGVVFDLPHAADGARSVIEQAGLADRCEFVAGDFFTDRLPPADVYILAKVLHDWDDAAAAAILRNCRRSLTDGGRVLLMEATVPVGSDPSPVKLIDLQMLVVTGGRERTETQWRVLLDDGGFELARIVPGDGINLIEARPA